MKSQLSIVFVLLMSNALAQAGNQARHHLGPKIINQPTAILSRENQIVDQKQVLQKRVNLNQKLTSSAPSEK